LKITELDVQRRQVKAPFDGVIVEVFVHEGEWVRSGDPILRVVHMDQLRVEGSLDANRITPGDVDGKDVTVSLKGQSQEFHGKVVWASPIVEPGGRFRVRAEVANQKNGGHWLLRPGMGATMRIHWK
jgi:multidrug resistance efflux pump